MDLLLSKFITSSTTSTLIKTLDISGSKSESNRLLILQKLAPSLHINNLSDSDDTLHLSEVLLSNHDKLDIGHAGTAMRFGTAYFATQVGREVVLTGSDRMKQRPIKILIDALNDLGACITYLENEGYPPLKIIGKKLEGGTLQINGSVSSQYLTALLLIGTHFKKGLKLEIDELTSVPYLKMTYNLLKELGVDISWEEQDKITIVQIIGSRALNVLKPITVESDWSSAGYWYSWVAFQEEGYSLHLNHFKQQSLQGDSVLKDVYKNFGVASVISNGRLTLTKVHKTIPQRFEYDFSDIPDQAQTVFATCLGLGVNAYFTGLHTLKVKETDRIEAMKLVGLRFRESEITTTSSSLSLKIKSDSRFRNEVIVDTFKDHRMAMAFAPLCVKTSLIIRDAMVVSKSYKRYWEDLKALGVGISER